MSAQSSNLLVDHAQLKAEWHVMRNEYHALIKSLSQKDFKRKTLVTRWKIGEIAEHMLQSIELIPQEIQAVRNGKDFLNIPRPWNEIGNLIIIKFRSLNLSSQSLLKRYDQAFEAAMQAWEGVAEDEWHKGVHFFGEGYRTLAENLAIGPLHFREHADQIRKSLN